MILEVILVLVILLCMFYFFLNMHQARVIKKLKKNYKPDEDLSKPMVKKEEFERITPVEEQTLGISIPKPKEEVKAPESPKIEPREIAGGEEELNW